MVKKIIIPSKSFFNKALEIVNNVIKTNPKLYNDYYHINDRLTDDAPELQKLIGSEVPFEKFKISAGTSDYLAFKPYLNQIQSDIRNNEYYRSYNCPQGNLEARQALSILENTKFNNSVYSYRDIALTEGSTGAISQVFEFIKRAFSNPEIIIASPTYYLYKFLAKYYRLKYREASKIVSVKNRVTYFNAIPDIFKKINSQTKLIVLVQPNNPTSQIYSYEEIKKLILICKKKNILLLVDELFSELIFSNKVFKSTDFIAGGLNALNNLVIVKGFSKSKNLAGFRIGYLFSKNKKLMETSEQISEGRQCFASASNNTGLIILDSFIQILKYKFDQGKTITKTINSTKNAFRKSNISLIFNEEKIKRIFFDYLKYLEEMKKYYLTNYKLALETLGNNIGALSPNEIAFNALVKIKDLESVNYFDFCLNFYLCCNIVTQIGPCYAFDQKTWQEDKSLGFWLRLSYSRDRKKFIEALKLFNEFKELYLNNPKKFLKTNLCWKN